MTQNTRITTNVRQAAQVLLNGGIIGLPTETVYGLAAVATNEQAVRRVFATKGRPTSHPLIVHLGPDLQPDELGDLDANARKLADVFWPGPLTLLVPRTSLVGDWVTGGRDTVALRVPSHPVAQQLLNAVHTGVVAPSANRFGKVSPTTALHVLDDLGEDVDLILDGGPSDVGVESTIVECVDDRVRILRPGIISAEELRAFVAVLDVVDTNDSRAPGMLASHYAPQAQVLLYETLNEATGEIERLITKGTSARLLHYNDIEMYAEKLYSDLRQADTDEVSIICAVLPPDKGTGAAIRDRLQKAAHR
ncbi:MAG: L-threonylcarbamoyladenylate synthase [Ilumatobacteraceae bacterium]